LSWKKEKKNGLPRSFSKQTLKVSPGKKNFYMLKIAKKHKKRQSSVLLHYLSLGPIWSIGHPPGGGSQKSLCLRGTKTGFLHFSALLFTILNNGPFFFFQFLKSDSFFEKTVPVTKNPDLHKSDIFDGFGKKRVFLKNADFFFFFFIFSIFTPPQISVFQTRHLRRMAHHPKTTGHPKPHPPLILARRMVQTSPGLKSGNSTMMTMTPSDVISRRRCTLLDDHDGLPTQVHPAQFRQVMPT